MEAKDTVMDLTGLTVGEVGVANMQAEISFRAGIKEVIDYLCQADNGLSISMSGNKWGKKLEEWLDK